MKKLFQTCKMLLSFFVFGLGAIVLQSLIFPIAEKVLKGNKYLYFCSDIIHSSWGFLLKFMKKIGLIKLEITDLEKIQKIKRKIIVCTHPSFIDIVILLALIPRSTCIVKSSLRENPILKNIVNSIFISEAEDLETLKLKTKEMLNKGFNVVIFPSGIRHRKNEFPKIRKGASTIALHSKTNIVALKMFTDFDFLFINQPIYEAGEKAVTFELSYADEIKLQPELEQTDNEIILKKNITNMIRLSLYQ